jgi:plasmid stabilization system protein ParE
MKLEFHPAVQQDFIQAQDYYQTKGGPHLADRFEREFQACLSAIQVTPGRFPFYLGSEIFRRIRLRHFPYLIIYREKADAVRVTVLKRTLQFNDPPPNRLCIYARSVCFIEQIVSDRMIAREPTAFGQSYARDLARKSPTQSSLSKKR